MNILDDIMETLEKIQDSVKDDEEKVNKIENISIKLPSTLEQCFETLNSI